MDAAVRGKLSGTHRRRAEGAGTRKDGQVPGRESGPGQGPAHCAASRAWAVANPDRARAIQQKHEAKAERRTRHKRFNPEQKAARVRSSIAWRERNTERVAAAARRYKDQNPEKIRIIKQNRRARIKGQNTTLSPGLIGRLERLQRWRCAGCACDLKTSGHELDHIVPLALDGEHVDHNMQLLCPPCNREKNAKHPIDWAQSRGRLL